MRILGLVLVVGAVLSLMMPGTSVVLIVTSLVTIIVFAFGALLFSGTNIRTMLVSVFAGGVQADVLTAAARGWAQARTYVLAAGGLSLASGVAATLSDIVRSCVGMAEGGWAPSIACAGLAEALKGTVGTLGLLFVAVALAYGICLPLQRRLEDRADETAK